MIGLIHRFGDSLTSRFELKTLCSANAHYFWLKKSSTVVREHIFPTKYSRRTLIVMNFSNYQSASQELLFNRYFSTTLFKIEEFEAHYFDNWSTEKLFLFAWNYLHRNGIRNLPIL